MSDSKMGIKEGGKGALIVAELYYSRTESSKRLIKKCNMIFCSFASSGYR